MVMLLLGCWVTQAELAPGVVRNALDADAIIVGSVAGPLADLGEGGEDLSGDGVADIVVGQTGVGARIFDGAPAGYTDVDAAEVSLWADGVSGSHSSTYGCTLHDATGDGRPDLLWLDHAETSSLLLTPGPMATSDSIGVLATASIAPSLGFEGQFACMGDLDGDTTSEIGLGSWQDTPAGIYQGPFSGTRVDPEVTLRGEDWSPGFAEGNVTQVMSPGDLDGDGLDDVAFIITWGVSPGNQQVGIAYSPLTGDFDTLDSDIHIANGDTYTRFFLPKSGDLDGDGRADLILTDKGTDSAAVVHAWVYTEFPSAQLQESDATTTFGCAAGCDWLGQSAADVGDLDGNGFDDLALSYEVQDYDALHISQNVAVFLSPFVGTVDVSAADRTIVSTSGPEWWACSDCAPYGDWWEVASAGDVDGDGMDELLLRGRYVPMSSPSFTPGANVIEDGSLQDESGAVYLFLGSSLF